MEHNTNFNETACDDQMTFLITDQHRQKMPFIDEIIFKVERLINQELRQYPGADESQIRRFIAGSIARKDLAEIQGTFKKCPLEKKSLNKWTALMQIEAKEDRHFGFNEARMEETVAKYRNLENNEELLAKVLDRVNKSKEKLYAKENNEGIRVQFYKRDIENFKSNIEYLRLNYNTSIIAVGVCDVFRSQNYAEIEIANTGKQAHRIINKLC